MTQMWGETGNYEGHQLQVKTHSEKINVSQILKDFDVKPRQTLPCVLRRYLSRCLPIHLCVETCAQITSISWILTSHNPSPHLHQFYYDARNIICKGEERFEGVRKCHWWKTKWTDGHGTSVSSYHQSDRYVKHVFVKCLLHTRLYKRSQGILTERLNIFLPFEEFTVQQERGDLYKIILIQSERK